MDDFIKALQHSQTLPDLAGNEPSIPDLFKGTDFENLARSVAPGTPGKIPNATEFAFEYQSARLTIGKEMTGMDNGMPLYDDVDESERLKEVMDRSLSGEVVIVKKTETFLKDGTVIIWLEWMQPKDTGAKKANPFLTTSELLTPSPDPDQKSSEDQDEEYPDDTDDD